MKVTILILFLFVSQILFPQGNEFIKGEIIDSVWVDANLKESFSIYIPKAYVPGTSSPVVFIFDPMARGAVGIKPFISTAETYGYFLVCSNNSKNGPYEQNYKIANRLFNKVFSTYNLDQSRIYTAGFSGGGRLATAIAISTNQIQGVVSCGAAFTANSGNLPSTQKFSYTTLIGNEDMNYYELEFTKKYLSRINFSHEIFPLEINHRWPDSDQILMAFDWMQLEAYKNQLLRTDTLETKRIYNKFYNQAISKEKDTNLVSVKIEYQRILHNFRRHYTTDSIQKKMNALVQSRSYKSQKKKNEDLLDAERILREELIERFRTDLVNKKANLTWWSNRIKKLKKKQNTKTGLEQKMYKRLLFGIFARAYETTNYQDQLANVQKYIFCYDICILIYPSYPLLYFKQIENAVKLDDDELALDYLQKLLETGYDDKNSILKDTNMEDLKNLDRFKTLMKDI